MGVWMVGGWAAPPMEDDVLLLLSGPKHAHLVRGQDISGVDHKLMAFQDRARVWLIHLSAAAGMPAGTEASASGRRGSRLPRHTSHAAQPGSPLHS